MQSFLWNCKPLYIIIVYVHNWFNAYNYIHTVCLLLFYVLGTYKVISGRVSTYDSVQSWQLYSASSLGYQTTIIMTCYPTQSHYPDTEPTRPCPLLILPSARLGSDKYQFVKWLVWLNQELNLQGPDSNLEGSDFRSSSTGDGCSTHSATPSDWYTQQST